MATTQTPASGQKLLGYVYDNYLPSGLVTLNKGSDTEVKVFTPDVKPDYVNDGIASKMVNKGSDSENYYRIMTPDEYESLKTRSTKAGDNAKQIPVYAPPIPITYNGKALSDKDLFQVGASIAGAQDANPPKAARQLGTLDSNYITPAQREKYGLPKSFDMLKGVDPLKPNWNLQQASIYNPTSHGFFGDFFNDFGLPIQIALVLAGQPQLAGAIRGATQAMNSDENILKGAAKGYAKSSAAQALTLGMDAIGAAIDPNAFTTAEAAIDAGTLGGQASGIASLVNDISSTTGLSPATLQNMAKGAATSAITGGDPLEGALSALAVTGATSSISGIEGFSSLDPTLQKTILSMASGATKAVVTGADPAQAALQRGIGSLLSSAGKGVYAESSTPTEDWIDKGGLATMFRQPTLEELLNEPVTPTESWIDQGGLGQPLTAADYATPTEEAIDRGTLGGLDSTATENWSNRGGLGGGAKAASTSGTPAAGDKTGATTRPSTTDNLINQLSGQKQAGAPDFLSLLGLMSMSGQQQQQPAIQTVGEIKPYNFSSDLLEGIYKTPRMAQGGSTSDLLRMLRG